MKKNIHITLCFLISLVITTAVFSQEGWIQQNSGTNSSMNDVFFKDQNNGWIVGYGGIILVTTNGGTDWISVPSGTSNALFSVFFIDTEIGWCVGDETILKSTDGGMNWSSYPSGIYNTLYSVIFIDQNNGWIAGGNTVFRTTNSGVDWLTQSVGIDNDLRSVFFVSPDTGWIVGRNLFFGTILKTNDGGTNWYSQIEIPTEEFTSVQFINPNIGWAVAIHLEGPPGHPMFGTILSTSDGGINWIPGSSFPDLKDAYFIDQNTGWVVDNWDADYGRIHKTTDGGLNWTLQSTGTPHNRLYSIFFTDANTGWAVGEHGIILRTTNGGIPSTFQLSVSVSGGWNIVSIPGINPDGMEPHNWWINRIGTVYKFVPGLGYSETYITTPGVGYWMKNSVNQTYNTGDEWPAGGIERIPNLPIILFTGWNLISGFEDTVNVTSLTTNPPGQINFPIYKYVPGTGYQTATVLEPGYGYWIKAASYCQLNITSVLANGERR
jgi:photosystem II stability/assembly factor-like uncharacterized protein